MVSDDRISRVERESQAFLEESRRQLERIKEMQVCAALETFEERAICEELLWRRKHLGR
jgi:hypothetical protein